MRYWGKIAVVGYVAFHGGLRLLGPRQAGAIRGGVGGWAALILLVLVHIALGFVVVRPWVLLLPLLNIVMAAPLGYPSANKGEPLPIWLGLIYYVPFGITAVAVGIGLRKLFNGRPA